LEFRPDLAVYQNSMSVDTMTWREIAAADPADFTLATMPARFAKVGDRHAGTDAAPCSLEALLELSARHEREGQGDAPWPPQYRKAKDEPARVQPSRRRIPRAHASQP
jgi:bifunctional non-homologous end joining protein LigD